MTNFRPAIRCALRLRCEADLLKVHFVTAAVLHRCSRPAFDRINQIRTMARSGKLASATVLAWHFNCTRKTIHRDLDFMRKEMGVPIRYNRTTHSYEIKKLQSELPLAFSKNGGAK